MSTDSLTPTHSHSLTLSQFDYALRKKGVDKMIVLVMEPSCRSTQDWDGVVRPTLSWPNLLNPVHPFDIQHASFYAFNVCVPPLSARHQRKRDVVNE